MIHGKRARATEAVATARAWLAAEVQRAEAHEGAQPRGGTRQLSDGFTEDGGA